LSLISWSTAELSALEAIRVGPRDVVYAFVSLVGEPSALDESLLDEGELHRSKRFARATDRRHFVLAHAALRLFLAKCLGAEPAAVRYEYNAHGKPRLSGDLGMTFNLSHSGESGLLAVARDRSVGVDIEHVRDLPDAHAIAETHFSVAEREALRSLPPAEQRTAFFYCWTRKEAVIKALGEGLGRALDSFDVDIAPASESALKRFAGRRGDEVELTVRDLRSPLGYAAAGAVGAPASVPMRWLELSSS
jgi:4'-phosphopantetheinyl transferase